MSKLKWWSLTSAALIVFTTALFTWWYFQDVPITSPLSSLTTFKFIRGQIPTSSGKVVYGFLPYWNMSQAELDSQLTHLAYFGLVIQADGSLATRTESGTEPGYQQLQSDRFLELASLAEENNQQLELVLIQFDNQTIDQLLGNPDAADKLITSLDSLILAYPISGINLDIEYDGVVTPAQRQKLTQFVAKISQHLDEKYDNVQLSIDVYALSATRNFLWDLPALEPYVDYFVVMAYDFHQRSSAQAGPVAPLFGGKEYWDSDINQNLSVMTKQIPQQKILLGIPFYGYEWQTTSREPQAHTFPQTGATASIRRVRELLSNGTNLQVEQGWNEEALSPYLSYIKDGEIYVIYYEDSRSLSYKLDYVNQLDLGGIAIWALGYEDDSGELWEVISRKL